MSDNRQNTKTVFLRNFQCATNGARVQNKTALRPRKGVRQGQASPWKVFTTLVLSLQHSVNVVSVGVAKSILTMLQYSFFDYTLLDLSCFKQRNVCRYLLYIAIVSVLLVILPRTVTVQNSTKNDRVYIILIFKSGQLV